MEKRQRLPIFSQRLQMIRQERNENQQEFAQFLGLSRATIGFYENGDRLPDAETLVTIAQRCAVTSDWLIGLSEMESIEDEKVNNALGLSQSSIKLLRKLKERSNPESFKLALNDVKFKYPIPELEADGTLALINAIIPRMKDGYQGVLYAELLQTANTTKHYNNPMPPSKEECESLSQKGLYAVTAKNAVADGCETLGQMVEEMIFDALIKDSTIGGMLVSAFVNSRSKRAWKKIKAEWDHENDSADTDPSTLDK